MSQVSAVAMARAVAADTQFVVPVRPCLVPGLVQVPLDDGLAFVGTGSRQTVLRGRTATTLIPRLLPALDGTRTVAELAEAQRDVAEADLRACVSLLYLSGILQDGPAVPWEGPIPPEVVDYLGRHLDTTRVNRSRNEACGRLARTRVLVAGPEPLATMLCTELVGSGVDAHRWRGPAEAVVGDVVIAVDDGNAEALAELDSACARAGISWLRTAIGDRTVELGPLFDARHTCCYRCFAADRSRPAGAPTPARVATWAALVTTEAVHLLSRVGTTRVTSGCTVVDLADWTQARVGAYRQPGCPRCLPTEAPAQPDSPAPAHRYEQAVALPPREWFNLKDHQLHYMPANVMLQRYNKEYLAAPRIPLSGGHPPGVLSALSDLLLRTVGLREAGSPAGPGTVSRWAPTGGNLGSVQAYLLASGVAGLADGWYFYQRADHSLARIRQVSTMDCEVLAVCPALAPYRPAALIVFAGALGLVTTKYHDSAYRIACLDGGVALAQLAALADGHGLATRCADRWDDTALGTTLRLDTVAEPVTAVVALNPRNADDPEE
jgi:SagB-type dehydrogenase family enzyme